jgi:pimeloyl-ACP methyl ester carboxylesterase
LSASVWLELPGGRIEAVRYGERSNAKGHFLLLHEGLGSASAWRDFPARLAARTGWSVLAYSRFGYGCSDAAPPPRPLTYFADEARLLPSLLDRASIGRCVLLGHSDGATIAAWHAAHGPDPRIRGLVLIAPHFMVEDATVAGVRAKAQAMADEGAWSRLLRRHGENARTAFEGWRDLWLNPGFLPFEIGDALRSVSLPTLMIQGDADQYGTLAQAEYLRTRVPQADILVLSGCGHTPHLEQREPVIERIADFCAD